MIKEFCAENLTLLPTLDAGQVSRVELCNNLAVGGTTPSYGVIKEAMPGKNKPNTARPFDPPKART